LKRKAAATAITNQATTMMVFEFQCVRMASETNSSFGNSILCSLLGDQKVPKVTSPDLAVLTTPEYHHSSAKGTFTPAKTMKTRGRSVIATHAIAVPILKPRDGKSLSVGISLPSS